MPIDLTTVPENSDGFRRSRRSHRRHRDQKQQRWHIILGIFAGLALLGGLAGILYYLAPEERAYHPVVTFKEADAYSSSGDPVSAKILASPPTATSAGPVSSGELSEDRAQARVHNVQRVAGADSTNYLRVEYEFAKSAKPAGNYQIAIRTPAGTGLVEFSTTAARRDVVDMSMALNRLGSRGPILVWIESKYATRSERRVSNIMTLP